MPHVPFPFTAAFPVPCPALPCPVTAPRICGSTPRGAPEAAARTNRRPPPPLRRRRYQQKHQLPPRHLSAPAPTSSLLQPLLSRRRHLQRRRCLRRAPLPARVRPYRLPLLRRRPLPRVLACLLGPGRRVAALACSRRLSAPASPAHHPALPHSLTPPPLAMLLLPQVAAARSLPQLLPPHGRQLLCRLPAPPALPRPGQTSADWKAAPASAGRWWLGVRVRLG